MSLAALIGGEDVRVELDRDLALTDPSEIVLNAVKTITENTAASPTSLWQSASHGGASPTTDWTEGVFVVDPAGVKGATTTLGKYLDLELAWTTSAGAVNVRSIRVPIAGAYILGSPAGGASGSAMTDVLTRIRVTNPASTGTPSGSNNLQARLVLWK